jgi:hypothetical protein
VHPDDPRHPFSLLLRSYIAITARHSQMQARDQGRYECLNTAENFSRFL